MSRYTKVKDIYDSALLDIIKDTQSWKDFLTFHAKVYKHDINNAVLIYAQRPEATLVADMSIWNKRIGRWINRGAKSIAVIDQTQSTPRLQYLFDIKDTNGAEHTIPKVWKLDDKLEASILSKSKVDTMNHLITKKAIETIQEYQSIIHQGIESDIEKSEINRLPIEGVVSCFDQMVIDSVEYMTAIRCGIEEPTLSHPNPFSVLKDFNTKDLTLRLGNAVSSISEKILRDIEKDIKAIKKEQRSEPYNENNSNQLHGSQSRKPSNDSDVSGEGSRQDATREVRSDVIELSERRTSKQIQPITNTRDFDAHNASSESGSVGEDGTVTAGDVEDRSNPKSDGHISELQTQRDDQDESRRDSTEGNDLYSEIDTNEESPVDGGSFLVDELTDEEIIDKVLLRGSGFVSGKQRIVDYFDEEENNTERSDFLKKEYGVGGSSLTITDDLTGFENYDSKGIRIEIYEEDREFKLTWSKVSKRIHHLIEDGRYFEKRYKGDEPPIRKHAYQGNLFEDNSSELLKHENFNQLYDIAPGIIENRYTYMKLQAPGFMDLVIEKFWDNRISLSHYYEQNGDLMSDPDMELILDLKNETLTAATYKQDNLMIYHEAYNDTKLIDPALEIELNGFLEDWLKNIKAQGHIPYKAYYSEVAETDREEPVFDLEGNEVGMMDLKPEKIDYRYSPNDQIGIGGAKSKFRANVDAIKTLQVIESEQRVAGKEEQSILAKYVGWGGIPQAFDMNAGGWNSEYTELKKLLSKEEYDSAKQSTPNAHYTSPVVISNIYRALNKYGFESGNILEPSMGVGNFFSLIPDSMKGSKLYGVELDDISGRISKQLYQTAKINISGFEETNFEDNFFDVAVGNVPFGNYKVYDRLYDKHNFKIHDYFLAKTLDKVRPGGVVAFVTSKGTLDKKDNAVRKYLGERAELLGAIRLPNTAFKENAGTDVTADILFLKKRERISVEQADWLNIGETETGVPLNQYFINNPDMLLGEMVFDQRMFGEASNYTTCVNTQEGFNLEEALKDVVNKLEGSIGHYESEVIEDEDELIPADSRYKNYSYALIEDQLYYRENSFMRKMDYKGKTLERIKGMMEIRDTTREIIDMQVQGCTKEELEVAQRGLN